jgi:hypothetical protein
MKSVADGMSLINEVMTREQPVASVTVTLYTPAQSPVGFVPERPGCVQTYVYGATPVIGLRLIAPVH